MTLPDAILELLGEPNDGLSSLPLYNRLFARGWREEFDDVMEELDRLVAQGKLRWRRGAGQGTQAWPVLELMEEEKPWTP